MFLEHLTGGRMKRISQIVFVLAILSMAISACSPQPTATTAPAAATEAPAVATEAPAAATEAPAAATQAPAQTAVTRPLVVIASDSPASADPAENWSFGGAAYLPNVYDTLFRYVGDKSPTIEASLAAEVPTVENGGISADGLTYTIKMKQNATFHDGSPVNADAVVYSYERSKALKLGVNGIAADWMKEIKKVDDFTVQITLTAPFADFLNALGSVWGNYIVNPAVCKANQKDNDWGHAYLAENEAGSGPYKMTTFDKANNQITLERYADYWGGWTNTAPIDKVMVRWLADSAGARPQIEKGDADIVINPPATDFAALEKTAGITAGKYPSIMEYYLALNGQMKPTDNVKVRQALAYSFNYDSVINDIFGGNLTKMEAAAGPGYPDVYPAATQYTYDLEKAKTLLKEAGAENLEITVNMVGAVPNEQAILESWQADLATIGVTLKIQQADYATWSEAWFTNCTAPTAPNMGQISSLGVGGDYPSAWEVLAQVVPNPRLGGNKCAATYVDDKVVNDLMNVTIPATTDPAQRKQLFQQLYDQLATDSGAIWIGQGVDLVVLRDVVKGYSYSFSYGGNYLPLAQMSLTE
jgi:peptide/nickel transport system substrate-binding protein